MQQGQDQFKRLRFGVFEADLRTGLLTRHGRRLTLQEQPFRLLAILLEKPGELVTREELRGQLWPRTTVDFDHGLNKAVSKIRNALGDSAENPRFIETVARRGYRFLADVSVVGNERPQTAPTGREPAQQGTLGEAARNANTSVVGVDYGGVVTRRPRRALARSPLGLALALVLAAAAALMLRPWRRAEATVHSLAVLPLVNLSGEASQDYLADGMTDELIADLGQIGALRVISRTSVMTYRATRKTLPEIARELDVDAVVEGTVARSGDQVRVTAQLIAVPADRHIWAQTYAEKFSDAWTLEARVAREIADRIQVTLSPQEQAALAAPKAVNPETFEAYLKGRYFLNKRTGDGLKTAIAYFSLAIEKDPGFGEAYAGLADSYALAGDWEYGLLPPQEAFARAKAAAGQALTLNPNLGEAHTSLAFALDLYGWDWKAAETEHRRAIELSPGYATAHLWYAWHLMVIGRSGDGISELQKAERLDPLSLIIAADLADALCIAHLLEDSIQKSRAILELDPNFAVAHYELGQTLEQKLLHEEAIAEFLRAIQLAGHNGAFDSNLAHAYAVSGRRAEAEKMAAALEGAHGQNPSIDANIALIYVGLGDRDKAMDWLEKAYAARFNPSILLRPAWDPMRSDVRFKELVSRIGLPR